MTTTLSDFEIIRPLYETIQEETLEWLIDAHTEAEKNKDPSFKAELSQRLLHIGCKPEHIAKRGHIIKDYLHKNWDEMDIYTLRENPKGQNLSVRSQIYSDHVDHIFEEFYLENAPTPDDLIHVSCTGYVSPSGAQKIASLRNWGHLTTITHAYHMGCYGSIPAIRMAQGFLAAAPTKKAVDIVHTEICSLHVNPSDHRADQLVSQSLFADGFIKYSAKPSTDKTHLRLIATHEEIIPGSIKSMTWNVAPFGFQMTLGKEVPVLIARALLPFINHLATKANLSADTLLKKALFAVHPGGPKILKYTQEILKLSDKQMQYSFDILKSYGNMSSATLPHIWEAILRDENIPNQTLIVSLAFGPGLSITGTILEKICGS